MLTCLYWPKDRSQTSELWTVAATVVRTLREEKETEEKETEEKESEEKEKIYRTSRKKLKMGDKVEKSRNAAFFQCFMAQGQKRRVRSHLAE